MEHHSPESPEPQEIASPTGSDRPENVENVPTCIPSERIENENEPIVEKDALKTVIEPSWYERGSIPAKEELQTLLVEKYRGTQQIYETFFNIASTGDVASIYRNRACFVTKKYSVLCKGAVEVFQDLPSARSSVYNFTGFLIHEHTHNILTKKETPLHAVNVDAIGDAAHRLLDIFYDSASTTYSKRNLSELLSWICGLCVELSANNARRPCMGQTPKPEALLGIFNSCECVSHLLSLANDVITILLEKSPESCMKVLFDSSRHGANFNWVWLHIAITFPGSFITHLLSTASEQFKCVSIESNAKKGAVPANVQQEYQLKFSAVSDVFNFLMRKRQPELQDVVNSMILTSLNSDYDDVNKVYSNMSFSFFFKLVTCSMETLMILIRSNKHLITPWNVIRAIRQISSVEKTLILANISYLDFLKQVVEVIDPETHGLVFETLIVIIYDKTVFDGENKPENAEANKQIVQSCIPIMEVMLNRIVRIAHATGPSNCPSQHPSISTFAYGEKLQFVIDSIAKHIDRSSLIIRHLHSIAIANGESKAGEIVLRFLITIGYDSPQYMYILMAFITTTAKFFPGMMDYMYREFFALKTLIELSLPEKFEKSCLQKNLLNNLRVLFEWEASADNSSHVPYLRIYPGEHIGEVLNILMGDSVKIAHSSVEKHDVEMAITMFQMSTRLIDSVCSVNSQKPGARKCLISLSKWYKLMAQFSILLKTNLHLIGRENPQGISIFEEMRTSILKFLYNGHLDNQMQRFVPVFIKLFATSCFSDSRRLFGEVVDENDGLLIDETGPNKFLDLGCLEEGPSIIEAIKKIRIHDSDLDMMHSGQLKKRRKNDFKGKNMSEEDQIRIENEKQRVFVVLDAFRTMCVSGAQEIQFQNSKQLALVLVSCVCKDALSMDMKFDEWEMESEFIHRHVEVDRKINNSTLCDGILRILCETRSFAFCLPIMKSQLAVIINDAEKNSDRSRFSEISRTKLHRWMLLASKSNLVPNRFVYLCDLEYFTTSHETFLMLVEVWRFMMGRNLNFSHIEAYQADLLKGEVDEGLPNEKEGIDRTNFDYFRLILQNHLVDAYHLFPKLFPIEYESLKLGKGK